MYTVHDFKTKKSLKQALENGDRVEVFQPGGMFPSQKEGEIGLEGPHYPRAHSWYATATIENGFIVGKIK